MKTNVVVSTLLSLLISSTALAEQIPQYNFETDPRDRSQNYIKRYGVRHWADKQLKIEGQIPGLHVNVEQNFVLSQIIIEGDAQVLSKDLQPSYANYIGRTVGSAELNEIIRNITSQLIKEGYLLPRPYIYPQDFSTGVVRIGVKLDAIRNVVIMGEGENNNLIREYVQHILAEKPSTVDTVQRNIALINKVAGYTVRYSLRQENHLEHDPNANPIDLVLISSKKDGEALIDVSNGGVKEIGKNQISGLMQLYSPLGMNESIFLHAGTTDRLNRYNSYAVGFMAPVNSYGTNVSLFASYNVNNPTKGNVMKTKDNNMTWLTADVSHYLILKAKESLELKAGLNYVDSNNFVVYNNSGQKYLDSTITAGVLNARYKLTDQFRGSNFMEVTYEQGLAGKVKNHIISSDVFKKHYSMAKVDLYRDQALPENFSLFAHVRAQAGGNIPSYKQFSIGGRDFGRAYASSTLNNGKGIGGSIEARYSYRDFKEFNEIVKEVQPYIYYDLATVIKKPALTNVSSLSSAGGGLRLRLENDFNFGAEVAMPMKKRMMVEGTNRKAKTTFNFFAAKSFNF
jgi:hemolysin activation/secretion protein